MATAVSVENRSSKDVADWVRKHFTDETASCFEGIPASFFYRLATPAVHVHMCTCIQMLLYEAI